MKQILLAIVVLSLLPACTAPTVTLHDRGGGNKITGRSLHLVRETPPQFVGESRKSSLALGLMVGLGGALGGAVAGALAGTSPDGR